MGTERFTIRADGPDGRVEHFYADTNIMELEVVPASDLATAKAERDALASENKRLEDAWRTQQNVLVQMNHSVQTARDRAVNAERELQTARERIEVCESALREIERACSVYVGTGAMADPPLDATMTARELAHNVLEGNGK